MIGGMALSVLIVDDDPAFLSLATRVLKAWESLRRLLTAA